MANLILNGSTSGSVTLSSPAVSGTTTLTLPTTSGTVLTNGTNTNFPAGSVLQVVQATYSTETSINSTSYVDTGLSASITPSSSTSKILVIASMSVDSYRKSNSVLLTYQNIVRGATQITEKRGYFGGAVSADTYFYNLHNTTLTFLDSPATTSSTTYKVQAKTDTALNESTMRYQLQSSISVIILMEIKA
jgi:hypothetical protein